MKLTYPIKETLTATSIIMDENICFLAPALTFIIIDQNNIIHFDKFHIIVQLKSIWCRKIFDVFSQTKTYLLNIEILLVNVVSYSLLDQDNFLRR